MIKKNHRIKRQGFISKGKLIDKAVIIGIFVFFPMLSFAWNAVNHQLIANIAYQNLNQQAKQKVDALSPLLKVADENNKDFIAISIWPDVLRHHGVTVFNRWHYVTLAYNPQRLKIPSTYSSENVIWAIKQSQRVLSNPKANAFEQAMFLSFLNHFVADIHQPLHTTSLYNKTYPKGDKGGNLFPIRAAYADNLHQYWDQGLNFYQAYYKNYPLSEQQLQELAILLQDKYPKSVFKQQLKQTSVYDWAQQGHDIAVTVVYDIKANSKPSKAYQAEGRIIAEQQIVLAGYRLAAVLNTLS